MSETKDRILDAAERLIAERGSEVSLRGITAEAGVNLAAVNYHFQSKDALWSALIERRFDPLNERRLAMLDALETEIPTGPLPLDRVLEAFYGPMMDFCTSAPEHFRPLLGRLFTLPDEHLRRVFARHIQPVALRFNIAFVRALPELDPMEVRLRMVFAIGSLINVMNWWRLVSPAFVTIDTGALKAHIIAFAAGGFRAPAAAVHNVHKGEHA